MSAGVPAFCCDERRAAALRAGGSGLTGIEFLEVEDLPGPGGEQRRLRVVFVLPPPPPLRARITPATVRVEGGDRVRGIAVRGAAWAGDELHVAVSARGDFSTYTLRLGAADGTPLQGMDPALSAVDFSFKAACPADGDCLPARRCPAETAEAPELDYLARDYASFRRLMLDRMALLLPGWREASPADVGMALVEVLAYVGDHLSYQQDAVAAEAYLETARRRVSVRRHARLLDYPMHDGRNARAWVHLRVDPAAGVLRLPAGTQLLTRVPGFPTVLEAGSAELERALATEPEVFETMHPQVVWPEHDAMPFWAWGQRECCLPRGATRATLDGDYPRLVAGQVLVLEEVRGPRTGDPADADPARRHAVRLTGVDGGTDPVFARAVTEVRWAAADALPFALCLSAVTEPAHGSRYYDDVSVARGNVVLADHGRSVVDEPLGAPPAADPRLAPVGDDGCGCGRGGPAAAPAGRFAPPLLHGPVTQAARVPRPPGVPDGGEPRWFDPAGPASAALEGELARALPVVRVRGGAGGPRWGPRRDLLASDAFARDLVVEVDDGGRAALRFGDDVHGERPAAGVPLWATYRVGSGSRGNVGADAVAHLVLPAPAAAVQGPWVRAVRNPLPARGGLDPEPAEHVRQVAPSAFRALERAVTADDYARVAERHPQVQRARASRRWTGSWHTVFLTVDRAGGREVDAEFEAALRRHLERYRMAGHDLEVDGPRWVPLELELFVCVDGGYFRGDVEHALRRALGSRTLPDGSRGLFHPDHFTFGESVFLSRIHAAAQAVPGVRTVQARRFRRADQPRTEALRSGELAIGRLEVARLDDDPGHPERGVLRLALEGGR
ncbi:MAG TPA: putative baseplate assembly protein [Longimicrobium sp.]|nr:putative baseplate assembly protein [Longimicrobium sp.]